MVLTVLDVFSRWNLGQFIAYRIRKQDVITLFQRIIQQYPMPGRFIVRNDNGSQFIAAEVRPILQRKTSSRSSPSLLHRSKMHILKAITPSWKVLYVSGSSLKIKRISLTPSAGSGIFITLPESTVA